MKRCIFLLMSLFIIANVSFADNDKPITVNELPSNAKSFIEKYFAGITVSYAKMETEFFDKSYEVIFANGNKVEFDKNGEWKDVDCKFTEVPSPIIPQKIKDYVSTHYKNSQILKIERDKHGYEVKLNNKLELTFNSKFNLIDVDD